MPPRLKALFAPRDMTEGRPWQRILEFAVPMLIGNFVQQIYNATDAAVVGRYVGDNALSAVGAAGPILNFLLALFIGVATGAGILVAQHFGAKDRAQLSATIGNCLTLTAIVTLLIMALGTGLSYPVLRLLNTPAVFIDWAADYLRIYFIGIAGFMFYNILAGILRGLGDSLSALAFLILTALLNIVLDLLFVANFGWGVAGVAWATVLAQIISAVLCWFKIRRMAGVFDISRQTLRLQGGVPGRIIRLGLPSGITQAVFSLAMLLVSRLQNSFGPEYVAISVILMRVDGFAMMPNFSFGQALTTFIGQNVGGRRYDRLHQGAKQGTLMATGVAVALTFGILLFGRGLMQMFTDTQLLIDQGMRFMKILALGYVAMAIIQSLSGVMRGAGDTVTPMWISVSTSVVLRVTTAYGIAFLTRSPAHPAGLPESVYISMLVTWVTGAGINIIAYRWGKWRRKLPALDQTEGEALKV
ncbi:MAG: MATE family efflux transporter [Christensenellales bacterium]